MEDMDLEEDVQVVVAQEATAIVDVLCTQRNKVLQHIYALVEGQTREQLQHMSGLRESISSVVNYFRTSDQQTCRHFLNTIYTFCENIPLELEIKILSVAGSFSGKFCLKYCLPCVLAANQCNNEALGLCDAHYLKLWHTLFSTYINVIH